MAQLIIGDPDIDSITELLETEGCPECGQIPGWIDMVGPGRLVPSCGHAVDAKAWIDAFHRQDELDVDDGR